MTPFEPTELAPLSHEQIEAHVKAGQKAGQSRKQVLHTIAETMRTPTYINDLYQVQVRSVPGLPGPASIPPMIWLSVRRVDRQPIHDWRHLQAIKNELVGEDHEAVELYPAEGRLVDTANQYHLWVLEEPGQRFPFGFASRFVDYTQDASGKVQRPLSQTP